MADEFILRNQFSYSEKNSKSPVVTISLQEHHLLLPSPFSGYVYTHTHTHTHIYLYILNLDIILCLNHLRVSCKVMLPLPLKGDSTVFSQSKDILLHNDPN